MMLASCVGTAPSGTCLLHHYRQQRLPLEGEVFEQAAYQQEEWVEGMRKQAGACDCIY